VEVGIPGEVVWTHDKARLIQRYLQLFCFITKHGAYIDGFAGPQRAHNTDAWAAKLVLEAQPARIRQFCLCDKDKKQVDALRKLADKHAKRRIKICHGDFNQEVAQILESNIRRKEATFCLLDQRTFECHWETVVQLARHPKERYKIELFYFLAVGWLARARSGIKNHERLVKWWGEDWQKLNAMTSHDLARAFEDRFKKELKYGYATGWPINERVHGGRTMYYMIHATDHSEAPKLMERAYKQVVQSRRQAGPSLPFPDFTDGDAAPPR
jgi:three-Cys-motif partner protein